MACSREGLESLSVLAKDKIGESSADIKIAVKNVKKLIGEKYEDLQLPPNADNLLERCLRNRKFDESQAATQVHSYFKLLSDMNKLHREMYFLPSIHNDFFYEPMGLTKLKLRDSKGRDVILCNFERLPSEHYCLDKAISATILLMDEMTKMSIDTQRIGVVFVCNFKGFEFRHARQFTLSRIKIVTRMVQGAFPMSYKSFHIVQAPPLFMYIYALTKPFLREKIKNRIYFHDDDLTTFHKHVAPDILPNFLGGNLSYEDSVDLEFTRRLCTKDEYYKELLTYGYTKNPDCLDKEN